MLFSCSCGRVVRLRVRSFLAKAFWDSACRLLPQPGLPQQQQQQRSRGFWAGRMQRRWRRRRWPDAGGSRRGGEKVAYGRSVGLEGAWTVSLNFLLKQILYIGMLAKRVPTRDLVSEIYFTKRFAFHYVNFTKWVCILAGPALWNFTKLAPHCIYISPISLQKNSKKLDHFSYILINVFIY